MFKTDGSIIELVQFSFYYFSLFGMVPHLHSQKSQTFYSLSWSALMYFSPATALWQRSQVYAFQGMVWRVNHETYVHVLPCICKTLILPICPPTDNCLHRKKEYGVFWGQCRLELPVPSWGIPWFWALTHFRTIRNGRNEHRVLHYTL